MKHEEYAVFAASINAAVRDGSSELSSPVFAAGRGTSSVKSLAILMAFKRFFDVLMSLALLPVLLLTMTVLLFANRFWNAGPMFYVQSRMGRDCKPFNAIKLRTMKPVEKIVRSAHCPLEEDRITRLGKILRKSRLDELPQLLNVLKGEMSMIGPRPDYFEHAQFFVENVPGYRDRHSVRPGISGLAQTEVGYAEGLEATRRKVGADLFYIRNRGIRMEAWIAWRTVAVILKRSGT